jgi:hypothetical protein
MLNNGNNNNVSLPTEQHTRTTSSVMKAISERSKTKKKTFSAFKNKTKVETTR